MIKAILFDWTNVIATDGYWIWLQEHVENIEQKKHIFEDLAQQVDKRAISKEEFETALANQTGIPQNKIWSGVQEKIIIKTDIVVLIKQLRKHYKVALLTNFVYEWLHDLLTTRHLYELFDETIISSQHSIRKPQKEIYQKAVKALKINKEEVIFIDDKQVYVDGAIHYGIKALLYTTTDKLKQDLVNSGVRLQ